jgi:hypothetical protein
MTVFNEKKVADYDLGFQIIEEAQSYPMYSRENANLIM